MIMIKLLEVMIGLSSGLAVGAGFVAFLTVLGVIPRLIQLSKTHVFTQYYETSVIAGALFGTLLSFSSFVFSLPVFIEMVWGLFHGIFIGMLAAALTEVLNVFPILAKRVGVDRYILGFLMALVLGKVFGSLFQWMIFVK
ncbi:stage V sporulation protein AB [Virgibacillus sp. MSP4-1]|uniref:stage V sporulation protein AB n=1 Tax=Virgibacillus sp. MSP4-1 TaxID=2700081 RepID=UPI00039C6A9C|nr:stage V sporulation protein AB [Virgibacillus sp. MSP4-1]